MNKTEKYSKASANVAGTEYNHQTKQLFVVFKSFKDPKKTTSYVYNEVPVEVWEELKKAESLGGFINKSIVKGGYSYEKL